MPEPIEFYFDFSSPYGYLAATRIDGLAARHGRDVTWRPILLGVVFKTTGQSPLPSQPMRGPYHLRDFARSARLLGVPFRMPEPFPFAALAASRAFYWLDERDSALARRLARAIYDAVFGEGRDMRGIDAVAAVATPLGIDGGELRAAVERPEIKERLRSETEVAIAKGVFGSPFCIVDGEPFWGHDRLYQLEEWLRTGGW